MAANCRIYLDPLDLVNKMGTGLFALDFICIAVNFASFYNCLGEPSKYKLLPNRSNTTINNYKIVKI